MNLKHNYHIVRYLLLLLKIAKFILPSPKLGEGGAQHRVRVLSPHPPLRATFSRLREKGIEIHVLQCNEYITTNHKKHSSAFTLIELVLSIVILSICLTGTMLAFITISKSSADPLVQQQAVNIGKSYLEEIMAKDFPTSVPCPAPPAGGRPVFSNVCDYQNLTNVGARAQDNQAIASLAGYTVTVNIDTATAALGALPAGASAVRIDVTVSHPILQANMVISGYRTKY